MAGKTQPVPRGKIEQARDARMVHALFFWAMAERATNQRARSYWRANGNAAADSAVRIDKDLRGYRLPWEAPGDEG